MEKRFLGEIKANLHYWFGEMQAVGSGGGDSWDPGNHANDGQ